MHKNGVVHMGLSDSNVYINTKWQLTITNFDSSVSIQSQDDEGEPPMEWALRAGVDPQTKVKLINVDTWWCGEFLETLCKYVRVIEGHDKDKVDRLFEISGRLLDNKGSLAYALDSIDQINRA